MTRLILILLFLPVWVYGQLKRVKLNTMKNILIIGLLFVSMGMFGQLGGGLVQVGGGSSTSLQNFTTELDPVTVGDTVIFEEGGHLKYGLASDLEFGPQSKFTTDTLLYFIPGLSMTGATSTLITTINVLRATPFYVSKDMTFDYAQIEVTSGTASDSIIFGIYNDVGTGKLYPGTKIKEIEWFDADGSPLAVPRYTTAFSLQANKVYWMVYNTNAAPVVRAYTYYYLQNLLGYQAGADKVVTGITVAYTYRQSLPTTFPAGGAYINNVNVSELQLRQQ